MIGLLLLLLVLVFGGLVISLFTGRTYLNGRT